MGYCNLAFLLPFERSAVFVRVSSTVFLNVNPSRFFIMIVV